MKHELIGNDIFVDLEYRVRSRGELMKLDKSATTKKVLAMMDTAKAR